MTAHIYREGDEVEVTRRGVIVVTDPKDPARYGIGRPDRYGADSYFRTDDREVRHRLVTSAERETAAATTEKPLAGELRDAAAKLRETAATAPEGPWEWDGPVWGDGPDGPDTTSSITTNPKRETVVLIPFKHEPLRHPRADDAALWIRMMSPVVAEPLAAWLEQVADEAERHEAQGMGNSQDEIIHGPCLAVARVVNGVAS